MKDKIPGNFMGAARRIMDENPELKEQLQKTMGNVADSVVKKKYVPANNGNGEKGKSIDNKKS
ncbi:hypothetical protein [Maridesulfovibrio sp.]|uniref:hypothetical protein n=1 Tax=Maridesulfovibrio sp. TaxID=2795000 RepID=UPI002A18C649|nr:hypothetical protein [Maridesulfovibrio sp.]